MKEIKSRNQEVDKEIECIDCHKPYKIRTVWWLAEGEMSGTCPACFEAWDKKFLASRRGETE